MKTILVTGCAGFIGSRFVEIFHDQYPDIKIVGIDNLSTGKKERIHEIVELYQVSIIDREAVMNVLEKTKPDYVFHFAAMPRMQYCQENPTETNINNIIGTSTMLECAAQVGVKRFIYSSSAAVYGTVESFPVNEEKHVPVPISFYGFQKYAGEPLCKMVSLYKGMDTVALRYFNVYGPNQDGASSYASVIARWLDAIKNDTKIIIEGNGEQTRDFVFIDDIVKANIAAMNTEGVLRGEACNIATNTEISLNQVKNKIEEIMGKKIIVEYRPERQGDIKKSTSDIAKAKRLLNWEPEIDFDTGLKEMIKWFLNK
jgi:nucleoside-diphosphate-sugar epimerase